MGIAVLQLIEASAIDISEERGIEWFDERFPCPFTWEPLPHGEWEEFQRGNASGYFAGTSGQVGPKYGRLDEEFIYCPVP